VSNLRWSLGVCLEILRRTMKTYQNSLSWPGFEPCTSWIQGKSITAWVFLHIYHCHMRYAVVLTRQHTTIALIFKLGSGWSQSKEVKLMSLGCSILFSACRSFWRKLRGMKILLHKFHGMQKVSVVCIDNAEMNILSFIIELS
jgi:hypothetical protein